MEILTWPLPPFTKLHIIHPRGGQHKVAASSMSFVPASDRDPRLWALLLISYALGQVTNLSKPVFPSTIWRKYWIFLRLLSKISCDLSSMPANSKCSMMALLLRLLRAVIRIIGITVWSQITMIWGDQYLGTDLPLIQMTVATLWLSIDETSLVAFNWRKQIRKSLEMPQPPKPI